MANLKLEVIPEPVDGTASIMVKTDDQPFFNGGGDTNLVCGKCEHLLADQIRKDQISGLVLKCYNCGSYNYKE